MITESPIVISMDDLDLDDSRSDPPALGQIASIAVSPDARRVYFGVFESFNTSRLNLCVLPLDAAGKPEDKPQRYADSTEALPFGPYSTTVTRILLGGNRYRKVYLGSSQTPQDWHSSTNLSVYDLDGNGDPSGPCRSYSAQNLYNVLTLALHPSLPVLYMGGFGDGAIYTYALDSNGEPQGTPARYAVGTYGKFSDAVSPDGKRLYLGTYPDTLEIVDLDADGVPLVPPVGNPRSFTASQDQIYYQFCYTPQALYRRPVIPGTPTEPGSPNPPQPVEVWSLDAPGDPIGSPQTVNSITQRALNVDTTRGLLWAADEHTFTDAFTAASTPDGATPIAYPLSADGSPQAAEAIRFSTSYFQYGRLLEVAENGRPVLLTEPQPASDFAHTNEVSDYRLRITVLDTVPSQAPFTMYLSLNNYVYLDGQPLITGQPKVAAGLRVNQPSPLVALDSCFLDLQTSKPVAILEDQNGQIPPLAVGIIPDDGSTVQTLAARIEVFHGDPATGGMLLKSMTDHVDGNEVLFLLPGYGPLAPSTRLDQIELLSEHAKRYLHVAREVALTENERPREFVVSCTQFFGGQGHVGQLHAQAQTVALLGINTVLAQQWGGIPPARINTILNSYGLNRRAEAAYTPLDPDESYLNYFEFKLKQLQPQIDQWAQGLVTGLATDNGGSPTQLVDFKLSDEPGWYYPKALDDLRNNSSWLADFRAFLQQQALQPADLGAASWDEVFPTGASIAAAAGAPLTARRLFYWTMRYYPTSASIGHARVRDTLQATFGHPFTVDVNCTPTGYRLDAWYTPTPTNPGPDAGLGGFDLFVSGRRHAHTLWTEDWFSDQDAQFWSAYADLLRSASYGAQPFGGYVVGQPIGAHPAGASYKVLSLVGHGAKIVDLYCFGPDRVFGDGWSDTFRAYRPIVEALQLLARAEHLLYAGQPTRGSVAILVPHASALWDASAGYKVYTTEIYRLHFALIHAGYTVDFVDDHDISMGSLTASPYTTLYVTGPNVSANAQIAITQWVAAGHTLVATPGGGVADEYNTSTTTINEALGLTERQAYRDPDGGNMRPLPTDPLDQLRITDHRLTTAAAMPVTDPFVDLPLGSPGPVIAATFASNGKPAVTINQHGHGVAIAYGFFPGRQYWFTQNRDDADGMPYGWGKTQRDIAVAAARIASTPRPVTLSHELVEACRLDSEEGIAIVLLNWSNRPIGGLEVTVPNAAHLRKVRSAHGEPVTAQRIGTTLTAQLPLNYADVLMLE